MARQDEYPIHDVTEETTITGYEESNPKITRSYRASEVGGSPVWGSISGILSDQTDLQEAFEVLSNEIENIATANLTLTDNRLLNFDGNSLGFFNVKTFVAEATYAPGLGGANFERIGYGSSSSDLVEAVRSAWGDIMLIYADGYKEINGATKLNDKLYINNTNTYIEPYSSGSLTGIQIVANSNGIIKNYVDDYSNWSLSNYFGFYGQATKWYFAIDGDHYVNHDTTNGMLIRSHRFTVAQTAGSYDNLLNIGNDGSNLYNVMDLSHQGFHNNVFRARKYTGSSVYNHPTAATGLTMMYPVHSDASSTSSTICWGFTNDNGDEIKLYKQDLPTSPTTAQIATLLSNLGLANLI